MRNSKFLKKGLCLSIVLLFSMTQGVTPPQATAVDSREMVAMRALPEIHLGLVMENAEDGESEKVSSVGVEGNSGQVRKPRFPPGTEPEGWPPKRRPLRRDPASVFNPNLSPSADRTSVDPASLEPRKPKRPVPDPNSDPAAAIVPPRYVRVVDGISSDPSETSRNVKKIIIAPSNDAAGYQLQIATDGNFKNIVYDEYVTETELLKNFEKVGTYYLRARSSLGRDSSGGVFSDWSGTTVFHVGVPSHYEKVNVIGIDEETSLSGIGDPSIEYDENGIGWMAYSAIRATKEFRYVTTHLAKSMDHGKTWTYVATINESTEDTIPLDHPWMKAVYGDEYGDEIPGTWFQEVPTLVYDPDDPGKEWKLFWHQYFVLPADKGDAGRVLTHSWIAYKYASKEGIEKGEWSEEIPLFGGELRIPTEEGIIELPLPLGEVETRINLTEMLSDDSSLDLGDFQAYTEPGSLYKDGVLYLSLEVHTRKVVDRERNITEKDVKIILLASDDHAETWRYVGTLLDDEESLEFGGEFFTASSLVEEDGRTFLFASPCRQSDQLGGHQGTIIFEFEDITQGKLKRDKDGQLIVHKYLDRSVSEGGESDYDEQNTNGGIVMFQINYDDLPEPFQIFNTRERIVGAEENYERITIEGDTSPNGVFDLSLEYKDASEGWMVYTSIEAPGFLHTNLAQTTDNGKTWTFVNRLNESTRGTVDVKGTFYERICGETCEGTWVNEVPTLVYDPEDPKGEYWKLFWHRYFSSDDIMIGDTLIQRPRIFSHGWIMYKAAASPEELDTAEEIKLFSTEHAVEQAKNNFDEFVGSNNPIMSAYSEPGAYYQDGVLYLGLSWNGSVQGASGELVEAEEHGVVFLAVSKDHGGNWEFVGEILDSEDEAQFGLDRFDAVSIAAEDGRVFLLACPIIDGQHRGTYIFEFEDITQGKLIRDEEGHLIPHKYLPATVPVWASGNSGESDYDQYNTGGGIVMPEGDLRLFPWIADIYNTGERIVEPQETEEEEE